MQNNFLNFVEVQKNQTNGISGLNFASSATISADGKFLYATALDNELTPEVNEGAIAVFQRDEITGKLSFVEAQQDIDGLRGAYSVVISPDGNYLYVAGSTDAAIAIFARDKITGELIFLDLQEDELLNNVTDITISPDGEFLYAIAGSEDALIVFQRQDTGELSFVEVLQDDIDEVDGLNAAYSLLLSADGRFIYVAGIDDEAIGVFERDLLTEQLNFVEVQTDLTDSLDEPFIPYSLTISPDNKYLYGLGINGVIGVFERDISTGKLSLVELQEDAATDTEGLGGVKAISISPDGKFLYAAILNNELALFRRDASTGKLTFIEFQQDDTDGVDGLNGIFSVATSPDSKFIYTAGFGDSSVAVFSQNILPTSADTNINTQPNSIYTFKATDFPFNDADIDDSLQAITIVSLPQLGEFFLDSNNDQQLTDGEQITVGQKIAIAQLNQLKFQTDKTAIGNNYANFQFTVNDGDEDSLETNQLTINVQGTVITNSQNDIFTIQSSDTSNQAKLELQLTKLNTNIVYEFGVFSVDDAQGNLGNTTPGTIDYIRTALAKAKVVLFSLANVPNGFKPLEVKRTLEFSSGENLRFYLIPNSTTKAVLSGQTNFSEVIFLSNENIQVEDEGFYVNYADFGVRIQTTQQDIPLGLNLQSKHQGEVIDLRGVNQAVKVDFTLNREALFDNFIGFYRVVDENGSIDTNNDGTADILVGEAGYTQAAVRGRVSEIEMRVNNQDTATYTSIFQPGGIFVPFMIVSNNPDSVFDADNLPEVYFPFLGANPDKADHIHLLGNNTFGFEDLFNGGDRDYNDVVLRVNLSFV